MDDVSANIDKFIESQLPKALERAMTEACVLVQNTAMEKAPHDTGNLDGSIDFQVEVSGSDIEGCVFTNVEYAPYVEFGTGLYATKGGGRTTPWKYKGHKGWATTSGMKAQPFLEPAAQTNTDNIKDCFKGLF